MRVLLLVNSLLLVLAGGVVTAQSASPPQNTASSPAPTPQTPPAAPTPQVPDPAPKPAATTSPAEQPDRSAEYLAQCMKDWDAATHMSKQDWARTCRRVVQNRIQFMRDQMK